MRGQPSHQQNHYAMIPRLDDMLID